MALEDYLTGQIGNPGWIRAMSLHEAKSLLPTVRLLSNILYRQLQPLRMMLAHQELNRGFLEEVEVDVSEHLMQWQLKIEKLGLVVIDERHVLFDVGDGYLVWKYPNFRFDSFLHYADPIDAQLPIDHIIHKNAPAWAV